MSTIEVQNSPHVESPPETSTSGSIAAIPLAQSSAGRVSGKSWKIQKTATVRSNLPEGVKSKWKERMEKTKKEKAVKMLERELKDEKQADILRRREVTLERRKRAEEKKRLEEDKAKMGAKRAARLRRRAGRTKKINH